MKNLKIEGYLAESIKTINKQSSTLGFFLISLLLSVTLIILNFILRPFLFGVIGIEKLIAVMVVASAGLAYYEKQELEKKKNIARGFLKDLTFSLKRENVYTNESNLAQAQIQKEQSKTVSNYGPDRKREENFICILDDNCRKQIFKETIVREEGKVIEHKVELYEKEDLDNSKIIDSFNDQAKKFVKIRGIKKHF